MGSDAAGALKVAKSDAEWREQLTPEQYPKEGLYRCVCCDRPLFISGTKFESGTGWPSFYQPVEPGAVSEHRDRGFLMVRTEIRCADCDAHLGHVFRDGPRPTGLRYCMNGNAMRFDADSRSPA